MSQEKTGDVTESDRREKCTFRYGHTQAEQFTRFLVQWNNFLNA